MSNRLNDNFQINKSELQNPGIVAVLMIYGIPSEHLMVKAG
jgi:hypothetical protein